MAAAAAAYQRNSVCGKGGKRNGGSSHVAA